MTGGEAVPSLLGVADELDDGSGAVGLLLLLRMLLLLLSERRDAWMVDGRDLEYLAARCGDEAGHLLEISSRLAGAGRGLSSTGPCGGV